MPGRVRRDCPVCHKQGLLRLPNHLRDVHGLDPQSVMESETTPLVSESDTEVSDPDVDVDETDDTESPNDDSEVEDDTESEEEEDDDDDPWEEWVEEVFQHSQEAMKEKMASLVDSTEMSPEEARDVVFEQFLPCMNKQLQNKLVDFSHLRHLFKSDPTFNKIMETAKRGRIEEDMDWEESLTHAAEQRKLLLDRILRRWTPNLEEHSDEDSD